MTREERIENCRGLKKCMNCAQSVAVGFADFTPLDEESLISCTQVYGSGMCTTHGTCGAITGAGMVIGLAIPDKVAARKEMNNLMTRFSQRNGATVCRELKGLDTGTPLRACEDCVADCAEFLLDALDGHAVAE